MTLRFGTDGVRGVANAELTPELVARARPRPRPACCGPAAVRSSAATPASRARCSRRRSRPGSRAEGVDVDRLGVLPTPAVACLVRRRRRAGGDDLGVAQPVRRQRHQALRARWAQAPRRRRAGARGRARPRARTRARRRERRPRAPTSAPSRRALGGRRALRGERSSRAARGPAARRARASSSTAPTAPRPRWRRRVLGALGADVTVHPRRDPTARNINDGCGSTHPEDAAAPRSSPQGADVGLAFDGDADRVLAVDHAGRARRRRPPHRDVRHRPAATAACSRATPSS